MAEDNDDSQKTEDPTAKRLTDARNDGNLPISRDLSTWFLIMGVLLSVSIVLPYFIPQITAPLTAMLEKAGEIRVDENNFQNFMFQVLLAISGPMFMILCILLFLAVGGWIVQTGFVFNTNLVRLKLDKLNFIAGFQNLFAFNSVVDLIKGIIKIALVGTVAYNVMRPSFMHMEDLIGIDNIGMVQATHQLAGKVLFAIFLVFSAVALADVIYQRFIYFKNLRMTKQEVRDEFRQTEGDPHLKSRIRQIRMEKARKRMMAAVPSADVIITNPTHFAIALKYEPGKMKAPVVLAKGQDFIAMKIREIAEKNKIPLVSNPPLARALYATVEIDDEIPPEHYRAVAEVISYVLKLRKKKGLGGSRI